MRGTNKHSGGCMGTIRDIFGKEPENVGIDDINKLIKEKKEESHVLEYKEPRILEKPEDFSKWISAFLNSDGGLIIVGISEENPNDKERIDAKIFPKTVEFVNKEFNKERIDQLAITNIHSTIRPDIRIYPIRNNDNIDESIYLVEIPQGDNPPYQAADKRYYRRLNSTKYPMTHTEIADFFGRRKKPKLEVIIKQKKALGGMENAFILQIFVTNTGNATAKNARIIVSFENLKIKNITIGPKTRIDDLRYDVPTLQWDDFNGVVFPNKKNVSVSLIWELQVIPTRKLLISGTMDMGVIIWEAYAEDMDCIEGKKILIPVPVAVNEGVEIYLKTPEQLGISDIKKEDEEKG